MRQNTNILYTTPHNNLKPTFVLNRSWNSADEQQQQHQSHQLQPPTLPPSLGLELEFVGFGFGLTATDLPQCITSKYSYLIALSLYLLSWLLLSIIVVILICASLFITSWTRSRSDRNCMQNPTVSIWCWQKVCWNA